MGMDFLVALPADSSVAAAIEGGGGRDHPPARRPLTTVHALDGARLLLAGDDGKLVGLLQAAGSGTCLAGRAVCDDDPVRLGADTDVVDVAVLMSDYNLITVPVVDERRMMIGVITVDDVLEVTAARGLAPPGGRAAARRPPRRVGVTPAHSG